MRQTRQRQTHSRSDAGRHRRTWLHAGVRGGAGSLREPRLYASFLLRMPGRRLKLARGRRADARVKPLELPLAFIRSH
jgi:hypothetical protein